MLSQGVLRVKHLFRHSEVLRYLPRLPEACHLRLSRIHKERVGKVLGLPFESLGETGMEAYP